MGIKYLAKGHIHMIYVLSNSKKNIKIFHLKIIVFTAVKYCSILHRRVCVMTVSCHKAMIMSVLSESCNKG